MVLKKYWKFLAGLAVGLLGLILFRKSPIDKIEDERKESMTKLQDDINALEGAKREAEKRDIEYEKHRTDEDVKNYWEKEK